MKVFVTGVTGQLGHDVMNELAKRGYEGIGSAVEPVYTGIQDGTAVTRMPYISLDITNQSDVRAVLEDVRPDVIIHCAAWTAVDAAEDEDKKALVKAINVDGTGYIAEEAKKLNARWFISARIMCSTGRERSLGNRIAKSTHRLMYMGKQSLVESWRFQNCWRDISLSVSRGCLARTEKISSRRC